MYEIILLAPLFAAIIAGFGWRFIGIAAAQVITTATLFLVAALSWYAFLTHDGIRETVTLFRWIDSGTFEADWAIRVDRLTVIMLIVVTTVSALVHLYSFGYMAHDENFRDGEESYRARFFAYLSFFTFAMLSLVTADNLVQLFFGWEGVGVASYLLIGFYYRKQSAGAAAMKAFIVNRVGDFGLALGIFALFMLTDSVQFDDIFAAIPELAETTLTFGPFSANAIELAVILLFIGAMGKSAQFILHTWLPDAMEGPTPVSALIHAATMVTAGVFLVCRMSPLLEYAPMATTFITGLGALTAFFAATIGLVQNDIKRVIAYSTCSQLGYMFVAAGVGMYSAAMFHLLTHAFFKAMLFLGAGSVIHGMHHEQDMRNYGGLRHKLPVTFAAMMIGTLAITGVGVPVWILTFGEIPIGFAGFQSKDAIVESAYAGANALAVPAFWLLVAAAAMTSFYSWRLIFLTFYGEPRGDHHTHEHAHESPRVMLAPLGVLAVGAVLAGMVFYKPFFGHVDEVASFYGIPYEEVEAHGDDQAATVGLIGAAYAAGGEHAYVFGGAPGEGAIYFRPDNTILEDAHKVPYWVKTSPFMAMLLGLALAYWMYIARPEMPAAFARNQKQLYDFLLNKWYVDEVYDALVVKPTKQLGVFLWKRGDGRVIDGGINGLALGVIPFFTRLAGRMQSGFIFHYALLMVIGLGLIVGWFALFGGR
ncbi:MAG: NADH-quinone oxidoreductase subunit L [Pseudomonadota bacterium]